MKKIKVLIADDSIDFAVILKENLELNEHIEVVGIARDGVETVQMTKELQPDILILDIIMPNLDGIGTVEQLNSENINVKIIMLSAILSCAKQEKLTSVLMELGVDYLMAKPFSVDSLTSRIFQLVDIQQISNNTNLHSKSNSYFFNTNVDSIETTKEDNFESKITNIMHTIGIPVRLKGYQYIREAILLSIESEDNLSKITKNIYPEVAKKFNSTPSRVERAIRHALEISWQNKGGASNVLFGNSAMFNEKRPTNSEFIASITDKLKLEAKQSS